ncbi:MAG: ATP phosphoribosyltransferase regulatory subunit, partial [Clostridia bacterium]|nr:ATP phosphoribosyltransferase regulatory subunit [Clostridia bacterium]
MKKERLLHTPEGVRDIYNGECARKLMIQNRIHDVLKSYGYNDISTPTFEFFDVFNKERGSVASNEMFKFFDRDGNTLVLRPDMTPSIARTAAKYYGDSNMTLKLCYIGNTFINNHNYQGRLKETTQIGAELIGDSSIYADAEIISMVIDSLLSSGLKEFQVEIGQVQFFRGLLKEAGIDTDTEDELVELMLNKNFYGVEELLKSQNLDDSLTDTLLVLPQLFGSVEVLDRARSITSNEEALEAIAYLEELYGMLAQNGYDKYITFDLGMLSKHKYYTGV